MELIDDLNICLDEQYFNEDYVGSLKQESYEINKRLNGYISYLKRRKQEDIQ